MEGDQYKSGKNTMYIGHLGCTDYEINKSVTSVHICKNLYCNIIYKNVDQMKINQDL